MHTHPLSAYNTLRGPSDVQITPNRPSKIKKPILAPPSPSSIILCKQVIDFSQSRMVERINDGPTARVASMINYPRHFRWGSTGAGVREPWENRAWRSETNEKGRGQVDAESRSYCGGIKANRYTFGAERSFGENRFFFVFFFSRDPASTARSR